MNMHGIIEPATVEVATGPTAMERLFAWVRRNRMFFLIVVLPCALLGSYLFFVASDQYESEAHFLVRSVEPAPVASGGISQVLSMATGMSTGQDAAMSVSDYLTSHDVVRTLRMQDHLVQRFDRPSIDFFSRLRNADPAPETLLRYYRGRVEVEFNTETGITVLKVHAFTPQDSYDLARRLLQLGEQRVNDLNTRSYHDAIAQAQKQVDEAEQAIAQNQAQMTHFRQSKADIDPETSAKAQIGLVTTLTEQLAAARAQLNAMGGLISPSSPQYRAVAKRVEALSAQVAAQSGRLTGSNTAIAARMSGYDELKLRADFLAKRYEAAATALQTARQQALRQQLYVVHVVDPNLPVKSLFPQRWRIFGTVAIGLLLLYSIGWLIAAGVREHTA